MSKKFTCALLALIMTLCIMMTACSSKKDVAGLSIANVASETVEKITPEMTKKDVHKLLGDTNGAYITGKNGFLATYIVDGNYIYSISVSDEDTEAVGYDGTAVMNSLKLSRSLTTEKGMSVKAEKNFVKGEGEGFAVNVNYDGKYTCSMNGYKVYANGNEVNPEEKLEGKTKLLVDVLNPVEAVEVTDSAETEESTSAKAAVILPGLLSVDAPLAATTDETASEDGEMMILAAPAEDEATPKGAAPEDKSGEKAEDEKTSETTEAESKDGGEDTENKFLGMLKISTEAGENVHVEIYSLGGEVFIGRVRL